MSIVVHGFAELRAMIGQDLGTRGRKEVPQDRPEQGSLPAPLLAGTKIWLRATLVDLVDLDARSAQAVIDMTVESGGSEKPVCVAQVVYRYYV